MRQLLLLTISILVSCTSCFNSGKGGFSVPYSNNDVSSLDTIRLKEIIPDFSLDTVASKFRFINLDSSYLVGEVNKLQITDSFLYILDLKSNSFFCSDYFGDIVWSYSKLGRGPQEHGQLKDFCYLDNSIFLLDNNMKILKIGIDGEFQNEWSLLTTDFRFFPKSIFLNKDSTFIWSIGNYIAQRHPYRLVSLNYNMDTVYGGHFPSDLFYRNLWSVGDFSTWVLPDNSGFYLTEPLNDTIYLYDGERDLFDRAYLIDFGEFQMPESVKDNRFISLDDYLETSYGGNITSVISTADSMLVFRSTIDRGHAYTYVNLSNLDSRTIKTPYFRLESFIFLFKPIGSYGNEMFGVVQPEEIFRAFDAMKRDFGNKITEEELRKIIQKRYPKYYTLYASVNLDSNPILISITLDKNKFFNHSTN